MNRDLFGYIRNPISAIKAFQSKLKEKAGY